MNNDNPGQADLRSPRLVRIGAFVAVAALHLIVAALLVRAFAPDFSAAVTETVLSSFSVTVETSPTPPPPPRKAPEPSGAQGAAGHKAVPRAASAPPPRIPISTKPAPRASSSGSADTSGAAAPGSGTGAGGSGAGTGGGAGGGLERRFVQIAGAIDSARDYPQATRDLRIGHSVTIVFTVGTDGRVHDCRVRNTSGDPQADAITCRLAEQRFRFKPSIDAAGHPVAAPYGWRQRCFYPATNP